jgi:hypothetical protein
MRKFTLVTLFFLSLGSLSAQKDTTVIDTSYQYKKVMIIPFEENMYVCNIQNELATKSNMNSSQIVRSFRYGAAAALQNKFLYLYSTTSLIHLVEDSLKDLRRVYGSISRSYEPIPEEPKEEPKGLTPVLKKFELKSQSKKRNGEEGTRIENGQIVSHQNSTPRFMNTMIRDPRLLGYLHDKYGTDLFVFLNEMDIENDLSDQVAVAEGNYNRILKFHYTVYNHRGELISKGVVTTTFPSTENNVGEIIKLYFPAIALKIAAKLPQPRVLKVQPVDPNESKTGVEEEVIEEEK